MTPSRITLKFLLTSGDSLAFLDSVSTGEQALFPPLSGGDAEEAEEGAEEEGDIIGTTCKGSNNLFRRSFGIFPVISSRLISILEKINMKKRCHWQNGE